MTNNFCIFLFGIPGSGKGVSAQNFKEKNGYKHLSMGEHLRKNLHDNIDKKILKYENLILSGKELIPSHIVNSIFSKFLNMNQDTSCIIDGFPRTIEQYNFLCDYMHMKDREFFFYSLEVDKELAINRLLTRETCKICSHDHIMEKLKITGKCNICRGAVYKRATDNRLSILSRIKIFNNNILPLINFIEKQHQILKIDANKPIQLISNDILRYLNEQ